MFPRGLLDAFDPKKGKQVVAFVGSGPSIYSGLPNWPNLLRRVASEMGVGGDIEASLNDGRFLDVAQYLARIKTEKAIQQKIAELINDPRIAPGHLQELIVQVPFRGIITTNYDLLLYEADVTRRFGLPVTHRTGGLSSSLGRQFLFHLHGHVDDPLAIVITKGFYDRFALGQVGEAVQFIRSIFQAHLVLFIGFGFRDDNVDSILRDMQNLDIVTGWNVYALVPTRTPTAPDKVLDGALRHRHINPIYIQDRNDHGVEALTTWLEKLSRIVDRMIRSRLQPLSAQPQGLLALRLMDVFDTDEYRLYLQKAIERLPDRPDLVYLAENGLGRVELLNLFDRVDLVEMRILLRELNRGKRHTALENALPCFPP